MGAAALAATSAVGRNARAQTGGQGLLARLQAAKKVRVGIANQPPFSSLNPDGTVTGAAPSISKIILARLGIPEIEGFVANYGELIPGMLADRWDFISAALTITKARCSQILYADPLMFDGSAIVYKKGTAPNPPRSVADIAKLDIHVGTQAGGADLRAVIAAGVSPGNILQFENDQAILDGLLADRMPFALTAYSALKNVLAQRKADVEVVYPVPDDPPHGASCAFRTADTDLHDAYQRELRAMKASGEYLKVIREFGYDMPPELITITSEQACSA